VCFHDFFDLCFILVLHSFHYSILVVLVLLLVMVATLLKLLKCHLELALRLKQVALIVILLGL